MRANQLDNVTDGITVTALTAFSVASFNHYLASIGLIIAIPIGILRLAIAWRDFRKGGK